MQHEMQHKKIKALNFKAFRTEKEGFEPSLVVILATLQSQQTVDFKGFFNGLHSYIVVIKPKILCIKPHVLGTNATRNATRNYQNMVLAPSLLVQVKKEPRYF